MNKLIRLFIATAAAACLAHPGAAENRPARTLTHVTVLPNGSETAVLLVSRRPTLPETAAPRADAMLGLTLLGADGTVIGSAEPVPAGSNEIVRFDVAVDSESVMVNGQAVGPRPSGEEFFPMSLVVDCRPGDGRGVAAAHRTPCVTDDYQTSLTIVGDDGTRALIQPPTFLAPGISLNAMLIQAVPLE